MFRLLPLSVSICGAESIFVSPMQPFSSDESRKLIHKFTRRARRFLVEERGISCEEARATYFAWLLFFCGQGLSCRRDSTAREYEIVLRSLEQLVPFTETRFGNESPCWESKDLVNGIREIVEQDPLLIGWAYQFWNEDERDASSWAISRKETKLEESSALAPSTQLFTESYMTEYISRRCLSLVGTSDTPGVLDILDPACGTGHFLVGALRCVVGNAEATRRYGEDITTLVAGLYGCDVDPFAVAVCRGILLLEAYRLGVTELDSIARSVCATVQVCDSLHGTLDRDSSCSIFTRQYRCVMTNPPYIGRRKLPTDTRGFLDLHYPDTSMDLCAAFMERCIELVAPGGALGLVTVDKWLRLKGYERLRVGGAYFGGLYRVFSIDSICEMGNRAFSALADLHDGVGIVLLTATKQAAAPAHLFDFISCVSERTPHEKALKLSSAREEPGEGVEKVPQESLVSGTRADNFLLVGTLPKALLLSARHVRECADVVVGLQTSDDRRFVRYYWSVPPDGERYKVHSKGGGYGRWFGFNRYLLDWGAGEDIFRADPKSGINVEEWFSKPGWTYTWFANGALGLRYKERGWSFGRAAASGFFPRDDRLVAFLNSRLGSLAVRCVGGKAQLPEGVVRKLPLPESLESLDANLVRSAVELKRVLVQTDPTDITFGPARITDPLEFFRVQALLLLVEGTLEDQSLIAAQASIKERERISSIIAPPVAWNPQSSCGEDDLFWDERWGSLRQALALRHGNVGNARSPRESECVIEEHLLGKKPLPKFQIGLPSMLPLEALCQAYSLHPIDAWIAIRDVCARSEAVRSAIGSQFARVRILEVVLEALGHRWWGDARPFEPLSQGECSLSSIAERLRQENSLKEWRSLLGIDLSEWLLRDFIAWQEKLFLKVPLILNGRHVDTFRHAWTANEFQLSMVDARASWNALG